MAPSGPCRILMDAATPPPSPSKRRSLRHRVAQKLERLHSPSSQTTRSSCSTQSYQDGLRDSIQSYTSLQYRADHSRLTRIEAVRVQHSIRKHDHRYYIVHVYLRSAHIRIDHRDPDYEIEAPYASFFALRDAIQDSAHRHAKCCARCESHAAFLRDHHSTPHGLHRALLSTKEKEERLERFLHYFLSSTMDTEPAQDFLGLCGGCETTCHALANFLKRQYRPTTGII